MKKNKGFTICLFMMSLLCMAISVLAANFGISAQNSFEDFFEYTGTPDAFITTLPMKEDNLPDIKGIDGVRGVNTRLVIESNIETENHKQISGRLITYDEGGTFKLEIHSYKKIESELPKVSLYYIFADYNNIKVGDTVKLYGPSGIVDCIVESTVSSPETLNCVKDNFSYYENYQFCYAYISKDNFKKIAGANDLTNSILIYFEKDISDEAQKNALKNVENSLGATNVLSSECLKESEALNFIDDNISTINVLCIFIPGIVMLVSLGFSFIFIKIIVDNQRKTIALLKSLGYSSQKIILIFVMFIILINFFALILGLPLGYLLLKYCVLLIAEIEGVLTASLTFSIATTIGLVLLVFVIGVIASLLTSKSILKIDPSAIAVVDNEYVEFPSFTKKINCNPFVKLSLLSTLKKYKRLIVGFCCIAFCIVLMLVGFEGYLTNGYPVDEVFGDRFRYDLMVRDIDNDDYLNIKDNVSGVKRIEAVSLFTSKINGKSINVSSVCEGSELLVLKDKNNQILNPSDGVIVDEMFSVINNVYVGDYITLGDSVLCVTGIAREIMCNFFYVSEKTATELYSASTNCILIKVDNIDDVERVKKEIIDVNKDAYFTLMSLQNENLGNGTKTMQLIMLIFAGLAFVMGSLFVFNMAIIDFNEKKTKYATFRAIGASVNKLCIVALVENLIRLILGIILAIPLSYLVATVMLKLLSNDYRQYVNVKFWSCLFVSIGISLLYLVVSLLISKRAIKKMNFVEKLNEVE